MQKADNREIFGILREWRNGILRIKISTPPSPQYSGDIMELVFDIGNTHTVIGLHLQNQHFKIWRTGTRSFESEDELFAQLYTLFQYSGIQAKDINMLGAASVVPSVNYILAKLSQKYFHTEMVFVNPKDHVFDIEYLVDYPQEIGADRLANVIAARKEYGDNVIAIDFGTAITIDVLQQGNFTGGAILPGFNTAMLALFSNPPNCPRWNYAFRVIRSEPILSTIFRLAS